MNHAASKFGTMGHALLLAGIGHAPSTGLKNHPMGYMANPSKCEPGENQGSPEAVLYHQGDTMDTKGPQDFLEFAERVRPPTATVLATTECTGCGKANCTSCLTEEQYQLSREYHRIHGDSATIEGCPCCFAEEPVTPSYVLVRPDGTLHLSKKRKRPVLETRHDVPGPEWRPLPTEINVEVVTVQRYNSAGVLSEEDRQAWMEDIYAKVIDLFRKEGKL